jgi:hypothetical protein
MTKKNTRRRKNPCLLKASKKYVVALHALEDLGQELVLLARSEQSNPGLLAPPDQS